ncbi:ferredoxin [Pseudonocardia sulfidoxydans NBRC 16205]|uniref:Ferredoxin n=1 Tax=Pseudonocardia sulfidoxydans NBRC 16205 TaxID=1223511 RepID=A0A511DSX6_9PSEU|nr:ferredoxin [Pseudonocardia sulfidoxydans]GEL26854.1 ferredoxin [Pseudonocardia sulfidoxydans NBRC 16205]
MRVQVDAVKCVGNGTCYEVCPSVFAIDDWGYAYAEADGQVLPDDEPTVREAIQACPEMAISIVPD